MRVIVTGVAGSIDTTTAELLLDLDYDVVALDGLVRGHRDNVPERATLSRTCAATLRWSDH